MSRILFAAKHIECTKHVQTIICRQLFAGHVVGSRPMDRKEKMHRMRISFVLQAFYQIFADHNDSFSSLDYTDMVRTDQSIHLSFFLF